MLVTMLTAMFVMVRAAESLLERLAGPQDPRPYMVHQPLPWQVHSVSHRRRSSRMDEFDGYRRNSIGVFTKNQASMAIASASLAIPCLLSCPEAPSAGNGAASPLQAQEAAATIQTHFRKFQEKKQKNK